MLLSCEHTNGKTMLGSRGHHLIHTYHIFGDLLMHNHNQAIRVFSGDPISTEPTLKIHNLNLKKKTLKKKNLKKKKMNKLRLVAV